MEITADIERRLEEAKTQLNWLLDRGATTDQIIGAEIRVLEVVEEMERARSNRVEL